MKTTIDPIVTELVERLSSAQREAFEEMAGVQEFSAHMPRAHSECLALLNLIKNYPAALSGLAVLEIAFEGKTRWLLTNNLEQARTYLSRIGAKELGLHDPVTAMNGPIHGMALLRPVG